jgi:hypothetical protein
MDYDEDKTARLLNPFLSSSTSVAVETRLRLPVFLLYRFLNLACFCTVTDLFCMRDLASIPFWALKLRLSVRRSREVALNSDEGEA